MPETDNIRNCSTCWQLTGQAQRPSLRAASRWLAAVSAADANQPPAPETDAALVLCRSVPACVELGCAAPIRRDLIIRQAATDLVQKSFLASVCGDPVLHEELLATALAESCDAAHFPDHINPSLGPVAIHAAIVANNLIYSGQPGTATPPGVVSGDLSAACSESLATIDSLVFPQVEASKGDTPLQRPEVVQPAVPIRADGNGRPFSPTAADLLVIHFLNRGVSRLAAFAARYQSPAPEPLDAGRHWPALAVGLLGAALLIAGIALGMVLLDLLGASLVGVGIVRFSRTNDTPIPRAELAWAVALRNAMRSRADFGGVLSRFSNCDVIERARSHFSGTPLADPACAAKLFKQLQAMPDAELVLPRLVRDLVRAVPASPIVANCPQALWLADFGERLLDDDGDCVGADVASAMLLDLLSMFMNFPADGRGNGTADWESSPLWTVLAAEAPSPPHAAAGADPEEGRDATPTGAGASFPRLLVRLSRRAASLRSDRRQWTRVESRVSDRLSQAFRTIWGRSPLVSASWQSLLFRSLSHFLEGDPDRSQLPPAVGFTLLSLCRSADQIREARERKSAPAADALGMDCARVCAIPAFGALAASISESEPTHRRQLCIIPGVMDKYMLDLRKTLPARPTLASHLRHGPSASELCELPVVPAKPSMPGKPATAIPIKRKPRHRI